MRALSRNRSRVLAMLAPALMCGVPACANDGTRSANGAQAPDTPEGDAGAITQDLLRRHIAVIADDSMRGRTTPSPGLDATAAYIASQFARLGLKPLGDSGAFIQSYPLPPQRDARAPNVVALLEGSDPALKGEYLVFSAHMDHVGVGEPVNGDSIYNGADDNASGTAAVLALAEAFARGRERPRRSLIFLTVSGEERGLWGSAYFASHPPVPLDSIVAALNIDMIGRNWRDTIVAIGKEHSDLGARVDSIAGEHPELNMSTIDDPWPNEQFYFRSDHYNFARRGVPALFFFSGTHADYHGPDDEPDRIDIEKETRVARLLYHVGLHIANAAARPVWNPESYRRIVGQR
jgi:Zn-dependent M28 family amino/carboxypeptidase